MFERVYRLKHPLAATAVDDDGIARFPDDTVLPADTEVRILSDRVPWREHRVKTELFYTIEANGSRYKARAAALDSAI